MATTFKSERDDWNAYMQEEHSLEEYIEKFDLKMDRERICDKVRGIMMKSYLQDVGKVSITSM